MLFQCGGWLSGIAALLSGIKRMVAIRIMARRPAEHGAFIESPTAGVAPGESLPASGAQLRKTFQTIDIIELPYLANRPGIELKTVRLSIIQQDGPLSAALLPCEHHRFWDVQFGSLGHPALGVVAKESCLL